MTRPANSTLREILELRLLRIAELELLREKWRREWEGYYGK